jgi:hypothetical protein
VNYLPGLASNYDLPDRSLRSNWDQIFLTSISFPRFRHRRKGWEELEEIVVYRSKKGTGRLTEASKEHTTWV